MFVETNSAFDEYLLLCRLTQQKTDFSRIKFCTKRIEIYWQRRMLYKSKSKPTHVTHGKFLSEIDTPEVDKAAG